MQEEILIPIAAFGFVALIIWMVGSFGQRKRLVVHETIRLAMEKGQELSPQMIKDMSLITNPRTSDLRRGVVLVSLAMAFALIGFINIVLHDGTSAEEMFSIAVFPGMIGLAFLGLWRFGYPDANG